MKITADEVRRVARLAHLALDDGAVDRLRADLDQILGYVEKLAEVDTSTVAPALGVTEEGAGLREDGARPGLTVGDALANAPEPGFGHFKVPRVMPG